MASTFTNLLYHIVYSTKYRRNQIDESLREEMYRYIGGIIREHGGVQLEIGGMPDHVHILAKFSPHIAVSEMLKLIKANSSKWVNQRDDRRERFAWQTGYSAFSVSESQVPKIRRYIQDQPEHHKVRTFRDEFIEILKRHNVDYDERYLFEEEHIA
jgi:putative transposase